MTRLAVVLAAVCALSACQKTSKEAPEASPGQPQPATEVAAEAEAQADVAFEEEEPVKVTPALVASYLDFRKKVLEATRTELATIKERLDKVDKDSTADQLGLLNETGKMSERLDAKTETLRKAAGLSDRQIELLDDLVTQLVTSQMLIQNLPDMQSLVDTMKEQAKSAPEEQRATVLAEIERMEKDARAMKEYAEARATFGDAAVDTVLAQLPALTALRTEMIELYSTLR